MAQEIVLIKLTEEDIEGSYINGTDCPLARASRRELGYREPRICGKYVRDGYSSKAEYQIGKAFLNGEDVTSESTYRYADSSLDKMKKSIADKTFKSAYIELCKIQ